MVILTAANAGPTDVNYDESKVPEYTLPDPLIMQDGRKVAEAKVWIRERRPEILELFRTYIYGRSPARPKAMTFRILETDGHALAGRATRKKLAVFFTGREDGPAMPIVLYLPNGEPRPAPVFLGVHLFDTEADHPVLGVPLPRDASLTSPSSGAATEPNDRRIGLKDTPLTEHILQRGYGFATFNSNDVAPDFPDTFTNGVIGLYHHRQQRTRSPDDWGAIGAWAWGLSRAMDYFETDPAVDSRRVIAIGHSRMGKTALWAAAEDERFAAVISNCSGCGGAALSRRCFGETVEVINTAFPHWFCENFKRFNRHEDDLPVDQHMLIALIAPRPVYVASAEQDLWADPRGEFLSARHADPVYRLLGTNGLASRTMPPVDQPIRGTISYHIRRGKHDLTDWDWMQYLAFADTHLRGKVR